MSYTTNIYEIDGGFGFDIIQDGNVIICQRTDDSDGNKPMTREKAESYSLEIIERLEPKNEVMELPQLETVLASISPEQFEALRQLLNKGQE